MEDTAQREQELHQGVANNLNQLGHRESPQSVNPQDHSALDKIGEIAHIVGAPLDEMARGQESHIEIQQAKSWRQRLLDRIKGKKLLEKAA